VATTVDTSTRTREQGQHPEFDSEQAFIRHAYAVLEAMREDGLPKPEAAADKKSASRLREMFEERQGRLLDDRSVCFGRIDHSDGPIYYIGANSLLEKGREDRPLVINWASEKAEPFYTASTTSPDGLKLRRRFKTERDLLLDIGDELFGVGPAEQPTVDDLLLDELARNRTGEMQQIAATIQSEQYRIIQKPAATSTVVQGGPGTGKTVVGLHRAALLLYRERERGASASVLVVGPNPIFMQYISYVLPSLGAMTTDQVAVDNLAPISIRAHEDPMVARLKSDPRMAEVLRRAVQDRVRVPTDATSFRQDTVNWELAPDAIANLVGEFDPVVESYNAARDRFRAAFERLVFQGYTEAAQKSHEIVPPFRRRDQSEVDRALDRIWPAITAPELLRQLLSSEERLDRACGDLLRDAEKRLLYTKPVERLDQVRWTWADGPLADELVYLLERGQQTYWHVVVDEAQDLTPMQLRMVGRRTRDGAATILGDLAQATGLWKYSSWFELTFHLGLPGSIEIDSLRLAYRVPKQLMAVALPILELTAPGVDPPVAIRDGDEAMWLKVSGPDLVSEVVGRAGGHSRTDGTVAIIAPSGLLAPLRAELEGRAVRFGDAEAGDLSTSIELMEPAMSKGLEFDHVYLVEPNQIVREGHEDRRYPELYVALTRATRTLTCIYSESLRWPLASSARPGTPPPQSSDMSPTVRLEITVEEALAIARMRKVDLRRALARALLAELRGESVAEAILSEDNEAVETFLDQAKRAAKQVGADGHEA